MVQQPSVHVARLHPSVHALHACIGRVRVAPQMLQQAQADRPATRPPGSLQLDDRLWCTQVNDLSTHKKCRVGGGCCWRRRWQRWGPTLQHIDV